jgi:hypothetical protein
MDKRDFDDAIGEVPPSTVDVDAAITLGRRAVRLRRVANPAVAAGVAVVLLTGAVAYTMTRDGDGGVGIGGRPTTAPTTSPPATTPPLVTRLPGGRVPPPQCAGDDVETAGVVAARLGPAATAAVLAQRPELELLPAEEYPRGTPREPLEFYQVSQSSTALPICDDSARFEASAFLRGPEGDGMIFVSVNPAWAGGQETPCGGQQLPGISCEQDTGPAGEDIVKQTRTQPDGTTMFQAEVRRADGTEISVHIGDISWSSKHGTVSTATAESLTMDQLVAIATDPALTLFPR